MKTDLQILIYVKRLSKIDYSEFILHNYLYLNN